MESALNAEAKIEVSKFRNRYPATYAVEGVLRLGINLVEAADMLKTFPLVHAYCVSQESDDRHITVTDANGNTNKVLPFHIHFVVYGKGKKIPLQPLRAHLHSEILKIKKTPWIYAGCKNGRHTIKPNYQNGQCNMARVEDSFSMLCYILKEQSYQCETYIAHAIQQNIIKLAILVSYKKTKSLRKDIVKIYNAVRLKTIDPIQGTIKYRLLRRSILDPDPHPHKFMDKLIELHLSEEEITEDTNKMYRRKMEI